MTRLRIGVTGINALDNPAPGIGVARSLKEASGLDVEIIGLAYDAMDSGVYMDWLVDTTYLLPYPSMDGPDYIERILEIGAEHGLDLVIPNLDAELPIFIKYEQRLRDAGIRTLMPTLPQFRLRGKDRLQPVADAMEISLPVTHSVTNAAELDAALVALGYPVMVKGIFCKAIECHTARDAHAAFTRIAAEWGVPIVVQQVVEGEPLNLIGVGDGDGGHLGVCCMKKINLTELGKAWTGVTVENPGMWRAAESCLRASQWRGPFELECLVRGEDISLIEINPRFPAWVYFATGVGLNLPAQLVKRALGWSTDPVQPAPAGKLFVRYAYEMVADMQRLQTLVTTGVVS